MRKFLTAAVLAAALIIPASITAQAEPADRPEVERLKFEGVKEADKDELRENIATEQSHCRGILFWLPCKFWHNHLIYEREYLDRRELARDVLRLRVFYWKRGFRETTVDTTVTRNGEKVRVTFHINEGRPTRVDTVIASVPDSLIKPKDLRRMIILEEGHPLNLLVLDTSVVNITNALWNKGYADAIVDTSIVIDSATSTARVTITVDPQWVARVGTIRIRGNEEVSDALIRRIIRLETGALYRREDVIDSQRALFESGLFRRTQIVIPPQGDSIKSIELNVAEVPPRLARLSGGVNTVDYGQLSGRFTHFNLFRGGQRLDVNAGAGNLLAQQLFGTFPFRQEGLKSATPEEREPYLLPTWLASVELRQRWLGSPKNTVGGSIFGHRRSAPRIYVDRGFGATATFTREFTRRAPVTGLYRFEMTRVEAGDVYFCVNFGVCELETIEALRGQQRLSPVALTTTIATFDDPIDPSTGFSVIADIEHASTFTASDFRYNRAFVDAAVYRNMGWRRVLSGHLRAGYVRGLASTAAAVGIPGALANDEFLHPRKRFYAGGSQSVRGFGENLLGPKVLTIAPTKLARRVADDGTVVFPGCDTSYAGIANCTMLNHPGLGDSDFIPRPTGGSVLIEGSVEFRFPIMRELTGAFFVDGAILGDGSLRSSKSAAAITPGAGVRYYTAVGPIRLDVGYNPRLSESLPVVTQAWDTSGAQPRLRIVEIKGAERVFPTPQNFSVKRFFDQLTLHFSIGQAF
jgi:outer membrane protein assembly factor BamA